MQRISGIIPSTLVVGKSETTSVDTQTKFAQLVATLTCSVSAVMFSCEIRMTNKESNSGGNCVAWPAVTFKWHTIMGN